MEAPPRPLPDADDLADRIAAGDRRFVRRFVATHEVLDTVHAVARLSDDQRAQMLLLLRLRDAADLIEQIPEAQAGDTLEQLEPRQAAQILEEIPSADRADLFNELEEDEAEAILATMEPEVARDLVELAAYEEDCAGGLMSREFVHVPLDALVGEVVEQLRDEAETYRTYDVQRIYVHDDDGRLVGELVLRDILFSSRRKPVSELVQREPEVVQVDTPLAELVGFFDDQRVYAVPVVDEDGRQRGVLFRRAVEEGVAEETEETFRASQGIVGGEELRSMPLLTRSGRRLSWLSVNIGLNVLAASIIASYQDTLQAAIALAVFLPIISDMSGCSGAQAVAVSLRELTLGVTRPTDVVRVLFQEVRVGLINGVVLGVLIGAVAWLWKGNVWLGVVVGASLAANTVVAVTIGGAIPLLLKRFDKDPALASGPILTTITDMCGFFAVLTLGTQLLERIS